MRSTLHDHQACPHIFISASAHHGLKPHPTVQITEAWNFMDMTKLTLDLQTK
jgi:hypothetical protein